MTEQVSIYGYRWHDSKNANTYHSVIVFADGEEIYRSSKPEYGYENAYQESGFREFLKATGQGDPSDYGPVTAEEWFTQRGIHYNTQVYDVKREIELLAFAPFGGRVRKSGETLP